MSVEGSPSPDVSNIVKTLLRATDTLTSLPTEGPYSAPNLSLLKNIDKEVHDQIAQAIAQAKFDKANAEQAKNVNVVVDPTSEPAYSDAKIDFIKAIQDCALAALPADTADALTACKGSSDLALELVRGDFTELDVLASVLYDSTKNERGADDGLRRLHSAFSPRTELRGALIKAGVDVRQRDWAVALTNKITNLRRLRSTPWFEVALLLKLVTVDAGDDSWDVPPSRTEIRIIEELYAEGEGAPAIRQQVLGVRLGLDVADQLEEAKIFDASTITEEDTRELNRLATLQLKDEQSTPAAPQALPKLSSHTRIFKVGDKVALTKIINKLSALSANNGGGKSRSGLVNPKINPTPAVNVGVAALNIEKANLQATLETLTKELENVNAEGQSGDVLDKAKLAMENAKTAVAPDEGWEMNIDPNAAETAQGPLQDNILELGGSSDGYATNEELVSQASGGAALYGLNVFPTADDLMRKPYTPLLQPPTYVQMTGAVGNFQAHVWQTTDVKAASSFHNIAEYAGSSVARKVATTGGGSVSVKSRRVSGSASHSQTDQKSKTKGTTKSTDTNEFSSTKTTTATVIEYIQCPMKSFRIPMARMRLSEDAYQAALDVNSFRDADEFLDAYGSHVSNGRQEMGGIFYRTMTMTSRNKVSSAVLLEAASKQSSTLKSKESQTQASAGGSVWKIKAKASASFGKATSIGTMSNSSSSEGQGDHDEAFHARYEQYIRCTGPRAATPETFAEILFSDNSSWAVTDRGPLEALIPVSRVLENTIKRLDNNDPDKGLLQTSKNYIGAAWRTRARRWGAEQNHQIPVELLGLYKDAFSPAQGVVQGLVRSVYNVLEFVSSPDDVIKVWSFWGSKEPSAELAGEGAVRAIREAADKAAGGSGASPLLHHLRVEEAQGYVERAMAAKEEINKAAYFALNPKEDASLSTEVKDETWDLFSPLERFGRKGDSEGAYGTYFDAEYFNSLKTWEQSWIVKADQLFKDGKEWTVTDYEVFQREYFRAGSPSTFLAELDQQLQSPENYQEGIRIRVLSPDRVEDGEEKAEVERLRTAVTEAAQAMKGEDWITFNKIWADDNPEETNRVIEIIEDFVATIRDVVSQDVNEDPRAVAQKRSDEAQDFFKKKNALKKEAFAASAAHAKTIKKKASKASLRKTKELDAKFNKALEAANSARDLRTEARAKLNEVISAQENMEKAETASQKAASDRAHRLEVYENFLADDVEKEKDETAWGAKLETLQREYTLANTVAEDTYAAWVDARLTYMNSETTADRDARVANRLKNKTRFVDNRTRLTESGAFRQ